MVAFPSMTFSSLFDQNMLFHDVIILTIAMVITITNIKEHIPHTHDVIQRLVQVEKIEKTLLGYRYGFTEMQYNFMKRHTSSWGSICPWLYVGFGVYGCIRMCWVALSDSIPELGQIGYIWLVFANLTRSGTCHEDFFYHSSQTSAKTAKQHQIPNWWASMGLMYLV